MGHNVTNVEISTKQNLCYPHIPMGKEVKVLESVGITNEGNISLVDYVLVV